MRPLRLHHSFPSGVLNLIFKLCLIMSVLVVFTASLTSNMHNIFEWRDYEKQHCNGVSSSLQTQSRQNMWRDLLERNLKNQTFYFSCSTHECVMVNIFPASLKIKLCKRKVIYARYTWKGKPDAFLFKDWTSLMVHFKASCLMHCLV